MRSSMIMPGFAKICNKTSPLVLLKHGALITLMHLLVNVVSTTQSDANCEYSILTDGAINATCHLGNRQDYAALVKLPKNTTRLLLVIKDKLMEEDLHFASLHQLRELELRPDVYRSFYAAKITGKISTISRDDLLVNLTLLEHLQIHIPLNHITPGLLVPVPNLTNLDLAYSGFNVRGHVSLMELLGNASLSGHRLQTLNITGIQRDHTTTIPRPLLLREHIYKSVRKFPLRNLDLTENEIIEIQAGLTSYVPQLEVMRLGSRRLMYVSELYGSRSRACFNTEFLLQTNLREVYVQFPPVSYTFGHNQKRSPQQSIMSSDNFKKCAGQAFVNKTSPACNLTSCICQDIVDIPCQNILNVPMSDLIDFSCSWFVKIPLSPNLHRLSLHNYPFWPTGLQENYTICFSPNNSAQHIDVTSDITVPVASDTASIKVTGLRKVEFCSAQGLGLPFSPILRLFSDMPLLRILLLDRNSVDLSHWEQLDFLDRPNLERLDVQSCGIQDIPLKAFSRLKKLRSLSLGDNKLSQFVADLTNNRHLAYLNLSGNDINSLAASVTNYFDSLSEDHDVTLDLSRNSLSCFCAQETFVRWMKSTKVRFENKNSTFCTHPTMSRVHPWDVDAGELHRLCIHFDAIISSITTAVGVAFVIGTLVLIYKRRWRIRFWIHAARESWRKKGEHETQGYSRLEFTYDAFVAYSSHGEERAWVHMMLREKLEEEHGLKLCMYHRDFRVGRDLADTIVEGINSSNKTLLILSPAFLQSGWCEFEVRMAKEKLMTERRDSLVIVVYSKLDEASCRFPKSLARLLERKIYIEWTEHPQGQELFWRRLVEAIKSDRQHDGYMGFNPT